MVADVGPSKGGATTSSGRRTALVLATEHSLTSALLLWLVSRAARSRPPQPLGRGKSGQGAALLAALLALLLVRPAKLLLRTLRGEGTPASETPGRVPFLGHLLFLNSIQSCSKPGIWEILTGLHARLGGTIRLVAGPEFFPFRVFHFTNDASNVEHILKRNFENYGKGREVGQVFEEFLGQGIFAVDGERWREQRKTAAGIFSRRNFGENMTGVFQAHARRLMSVLRRKAAQQPQAEIELQELFFSLTLDAFCEIGFGVPWNSVEGGEAADGPTPAEGPSGAALREWARHFDAAQHVIVTRFAYRPLWKLERVLGRCGLLPAGHDESAFVRSIRYMNDVVGQLLDQRFQKTDGKARADLLSLFMEAIRDRAYLRDIVMSFIIAGRDTTACTLTWLFWEFSQSPQALARAREEVLQVASEEQRSDGGAGSASDFTFEQLSRLKYTTACVRETVRLHPPVPVDPKVAFGDDTLPDGSLVARGDYVIFEPYMMARDPSNWGPDAAEWRPERWLAMEKEPSAYVNCAFQAGPRICLGRDMAILEVRAVLVQAVLSGVQWEVRPGYMPTYRYPSLVLPMARPGLPARISFIGAPSSNS